jgi:hypothetical protein
MLDCKDFSISILKCVTLRRKMRLKIASLIYNFFSIESNTIKSNYIPTNVQNTVHHV